MTSQTVTIEVAPQVAILLRSLQQAAEERGLSLDVLLSSLLPANWHHREMTPDQRADDFLSWIKANAVRVDHFVDDSRESICTREDKAR